MLLNTKEIFKTSTMAKPRPPVEERFYSNLLCFKKLIKQSLIGEQSCISPELVDLLFSYLDCVDKETLMVNFIEKTYPLWDEFAKGRNLKMILEKSFMLFEELGDDKIEEITRLISRKNEEGGEVVDKTWTLIECLVKVSLRYIHEQRKPAIVDDLIVYENENVFSEIDLPRYANIYRMTL